MIMNKLPFEAFVEILRENSQIDKILDIYDSDRYEPAVEPNVNHIFIAKLVAKGKLRTIMTTNFDQLIEKALKQQGLREGQDFDVLYKEEDFRRIDWSSDRVRLIKIHGSIHDKEAMAITLRQISNSELSEAKAGITRQIFSQGQHQQVLILGYSCSDVFDLTPQIKALTDNLKQVCLVQHSSYNRIEDIRTQMVKNPFKAFMNSTRLYLNTDCFVQDVWKTTIDDPWPNASKMNHTNWKVKVLAWYVDNIQEYSEAIKGSITGKLFIDIAQWPVAIRCYERVRDFAREHHNNQLEGIALCI